MATGIENVLFLLGFQAIGSWLKVEDEITAFLQTDTARKKNYACLDMLIGRYTGWYTMVLSFDALALKWSYRESPFPILAQLANDKIDYTVFFITDGYLLSHKALGKEYLSGLQKFASNKSLHSLYIGEQDPDPQKERGIFRLSEFASVKCLPGYSRKEGEIKQWLVECLK